MIYLQTFFWFPTIWWHIIFGSYLCPTFVCQYCRRARIIYIYKIINFKIFCIVNVIINITSSNQPRSATSSFLSLSFLSTVSTAAVRSSGVVKLCDRWTPAGLPASPPPALFSTTSNTSGNCLNCCTIFGRTKPTWAPSMKKPKQSLREDPGTDTSFKNIKNKQTHTVWCVSILILT